MKDDTLRILEFDKVLETIAGFSHSNATRKAIIEIRPLNNKADLDNRFELIREIKQLNDKGGPLRLSSFEDIAPYLEKLRPEDSILEAIELYSFIALLRMILEISEQVKESNDCPFLKSLASNLRGFPEILKTLVRSIDSEGKILDSASPLLLQLRTGLRSLERSIRKRLEDKMSDRRVTPFLQDNFISHRGGRWVIPVRMDSKGQVQGVVHDVSRSGDTAFIEPLEIIGLANELENLMADAKTEEIRILKALSRNIRDVMNELSAQYKAIVHIDLLNSITCFGELFKAEIPEISSALVIKLVKARHPLLELLWMKEAAKNVIPLDLELSGENKVMVITGPNAGGKTIAIKTVGLLLLMALCGIPVPADSSSVFPFVSRILVDIGDEQSIEASLSTFSAHVSKISHILKSESANTVVLLDELGTGTEPSQGSAIACAVLKELKKKGNLVFATTHLIEIAGFVQRTEGMLNASMEFDTEKFSPLYMLRLGEPGQSHAIETALRFGLPEGIIISAKELLGRMNIELYDLIADLREKRNRYEETIRDLENKKRELEKKEIVLKERTFELDKKRKEIEGDAYREADAIIRNTKSQVRALLEEAKEKDREAIKKAEKMHREVTKKLKSFQAETSVPLDEITIGDVVFAGSIGCDATVIGIDRKHKRLKIRAKGIDIDVSALDITVKKGTAPLPEAEAYRGIEETPVSSRINLVGLRVDEAISRLEPFLNHATLAGLNEVIIIHGVGTGALLKAVHEHLMRHPLINEFRSGNRTEGGKGVTVAKLK